MTTIGSLFSGYLGLDLAVREVIPDAETVFVADIDPGAAKVLAHRAPWGKYTPAIHRWETTLGRPAPAPTETGPKGNPRLSCRFDEWLMGLPDGWITDVPGITHNETLRLAGNGVVPQQGAAALRHLLAVRESVLSAYQEVSA